EAVRDGQGLSRPPFITYPSNDDRNNRLAPVGRANGDDMIASVRTGLWAVVLGALPLPALAQGHPTITVYTYDALAAAWRAAPGLKEGVGAQCECTLEFVSAEDAISALRRVQLEGESTQADIVLGLDAATIGEGMATGLFVEHGLDLPEFE